MADFKPTISKGDIEHISNLGQIIITTTEDKLKNNLNEFIPIIGLRKAWLTPFALCVSVLGTLLTANFADKFGQTGDFWNASFTIIFIFSAIWTIYSLFKLAKRWKDTQIEKLLKTIKNENC
ncbi:MAG: hypothetical protein D8M58_15985 [Calditrichaeota bacterium]|nr:MAG: hypothetical protein DWQ03_07715 [Calditrichota bacterium]MBL1206905.1 hypothetical protein [Calditrichota bacterium]NOG46731.1 hypothetical protein [Calditrichota bacterium]